MRKFEKVSFEQFLKDCERTGWKKEYNDGTLKKFYDKIELPKRFTKGSAGYDFVTPFPLYIGDLSSPVEFPTGIRVQLEEDEALLLLPRSGIGFNTGVTIACTVGLIDSDYYNAENEGHIMCKLVSGFRPLSVSQYGRVMQGVIVKFATVDDDETTGTRVGGFGSTGTGGKNE